MKKIIIAPKIHVYSELIDDVDDLLSFIKLTESNEKNLHIFGPWKNWNALWHGKSFKVANENQTIYKEDGPITKKEKSIVNEIRSVLNNVFNDYISSYEKDASWPDFIKKWGSYGEFPWMVCEEIDFLKYNQDQPEELKNAPLAMNYHTDEDKFDINNAGTKKIATTTIYLNDNYEGGEICIYDPVEKKVYAYKPKKGDVTIFPSGMMYYHGVMPFSGSDRYLIRMFSNYYYEGSDDFKALVNEIGWDAVHEKIKLDREKTWKNGGNLVNMVFPETSSSNPNISSIYLDEKVIYVKGGKNE